MAEFGHLLQLLLLLQGGIFQRSSSYRPATGMQFGLLRFQRGRYRWQGGFGTARVVERILLTSGVAVVVVVGGGCGLAATSVMAVRTADRAVVMLLRRRLAGQAAIGRIGAELRSLGRRSPVAAAIASRRITQRVALHAGHLVRVGRIHRRGRFAHPVQLLDALHQVSLCRREIIETDTSATAAVATIADGCRSTNTSVADAVAIGSGGGCSWRRRR